MHININKKYKNNDEFFKDILEILLWFLRQDEHTNHIWNKIGINLKVCAVWVFAGNNATMEIKFDKARKKKKRQKEEEKWKE